MALHFEPDIFDLSLLLMSFVTLQIWSKNIKMKSINLTALKKHGKVYEDGELSALKKFFLLTRFFKTISNVL